MRWIGTPREDLIFFFGSPLAAGSLGLLLMAAPWLLVPCWWLWLLLGDGPHLAATWTRTYGDPEIRRAYPRLLTWTPMFYLVGPAVWALGRLMNSHLPFDGFLGIALLWAWQHTVRQHYGIVALYARLDQQSEEELTCDRFILHGLLWGLFGLFVLAYPANRTILGLPYGLSIQWGIWILTGTLTAGAAGYVLLLIQRHRTGRPIRAGIYGLAFAAGIAAFAFFIVGAHEPLLENPRTPEQMFMATSLLGGLVHTVQYLGLVSIANRRRAQHRRTQGQEFRWGNARKTYATLVLVSSFYLVLNTLRGDVPGLSFLSLQQPLGQLALALYWGLFFHHYYLDQWIWHPSRDPQLRLELGLEAA